MSPLSEIAPKGKALTVKKTFSRTTTISQRIDANSSIVWAVLINISDYSRWNSTIISIEGKLQKGEKIKLISTLDPSRTFKLKVKEIETERKLVWGDALGQRTFILEKKGAATFFTMKERIGGPLFPLFANKIPPFDQSFEQFIFDLKKEAETVAKSK